VEQSLSWISRALCSAMRFVYKDMELSIFMYKSTSNACRQAWNMFLFFFFTILRYIRPFILSHGQDIDKLSPKGHTGCGRLHAPPMFVSSPHSPPALTVAWALLNEIAVYTLRTTRRGWVGDRSHLE
jgi:hypothetical protein